MATTGGTTRIKQPSLREIVTEGFKSVNARLDNIESRLEKVENRLETVIKLNNLKTK
jgi:tetrahydromethanopterin S-methyltransferase subunit G